jgi:hypothetical protein
MALKKDNITNLKHTLNKTTRLKHKKNIESKFKMFITGFSDVTGFTVISTLEAVTTLALKYLLKLNIISTTQAITLINFTVRKSIEIDCKLEANSSLDFRKEAREQILSELEALVGTDRKLFELDSLTLDEMDLLTLGELDFSEGIIFILRKKLQINSTTETNTLLDLYMYYYNRLNDLDSQTLGDLDLLTLGELDRTLIT